MARKTLLKVALGAASLLAVRRWLGRKPFELAGKVVLLTGGSRGLGLVLARQLAERGAKLAICGREVTSLERARAGLVAHGADVEVVDCDVGDAEQVERMVEQVLAHYGRIDVLINNAGIIQVGPEEVMTLADYEEAMRVHFWGPLHTLRAVLPGMKERREGRIVNITSIGGKLSIPHLLPYSASKFALVGLSEGLHAELAKDGIQVTTVCPGLMRTGSPRNADFKGKHRAEYAWFKLSDSLPLVSIDAERAAAEILQALERGKAEVILSAPAKVATWVHGLFPGLTATALGWVNRLLPKAGGIGEKKAQGKESESFVSRSWLASSTDSAAMRNNELL